MTEASSASKQQEPPVSGGEAMASDDTMQTLAGSASRWISVSELRGRPGTGQQMIFVTRWSSLSEEQPVEPAAEVDHEPAPGAESAMPLLPPLDLLRTIAARWLRLVAGEQAEEPSLVAFRVSGSLSPEEVARWCPGATVRLYTLGGSVAPLPDTALGEEPLARYSLVRAPNMNFWPELRVMIEEQERDQPGMEHWEDREPDLALLEQELAWWLASPHGLVLNLYAGEELVGHLALARQRDEAEGCDGWGILALHIARKARGQQLSVLLQRVAATLIVARRMQRQITQMLRAVRHVPARATGPAETAHMPVGERSNTSGNAAPPAQDANPADKGPASFEAASAPPSPAADQGAPVDMLEQPWPYLFGLIPPHNIPALRGAYAAGRRIIGTYVDVPLAALERWE